jgi:hypothetical protein
VTIDDIMNGTRNRMRKTIIGLIDIVPDSTKLFSLISRDGGIIILLPLKINFVGMIDEREFFITRTNLSGSALKKKKKKKMEKVLE